MSEARLLSSVPIYLEWPECLDSCAEVEPEKEDLTFGPARRNNSSVKNTRRINLAFTAKDLKGLQYQICSSVSLVLNPITHDSDIVKGVATTTPSCSCTVLSGTLGVVGSGFAAGGRVDSSCQMNIGVIFAVLWGQHWWKSGLKDHCMIARLGGIHIPSSRLWFLRQRKLCRRHFKGSWLLVHCWSLTPLHILSGLNSDNHHLNKSWWVIGAQIGFTRSSLEISRRVNKKKKQGSSCPETEEMQKKTQSKERRKDRTLTPPFCWLGNSDRHQRSSSQINCCSNHMENNEISNYHESSDDCAHSASFL